MRSVGMLTNLNYEAMKTLLGERIMDRMTMNGGRWVNFNWGELASECRPARIAK